MSANHANNLVNLVNVVVIRGSVRNEPSTRELASGDKVCQFDVRVAGNGDSPPVDVPVSWFDVQRPPEVGDVVLVVGSVRRRFFRAAGATVSRTDVLARSVIGWRRRQAVQRALGEVVAQIQSSQRP